MFGLFRINKIAIALVGACSLTACIAVNPDENTRPALAGYNGNTVTIQADGNEAYNTTPTNDILALAAKTCGSAGKKAEYASTRTSVGYFRNEHLFLCI